MGAFWLLGFGAMVAFFATQSISLPVGLLWGAVVLIGLVLALRAIRRTPTGELRWDGADWYWSGFAAALPCRLVLHMDWQRCLLVTLDHPSERRIWLWLEPQTDGPAWLALRRAVVGARRAERVRADPSSSNTVQESA